MRIKMPPSPGAQVALWIALLASVAWSGAAQAAGIAWRVDAPLEQALKEARARDAVVMVDVYADWCGPCQRYDKEVFALDDVNKAVAGAIPVKINAEKGEGPSIVERYHVVGYPTILFLNARGQEIDRIFGYLEPEDFKKKAGDFIAGRQTITDLQKKLAAAPGDHALRFEVGERLVIRGDLKAALPLLAPIFDHDKVNAHGFAPKIHHLLGKYAYLRGKKDYALATLHLSAIIDRYPDSPEAKGAPYDLATAWHGAGEAAKAMETFERWIAAEAGSAGRYNAVAWFCFQKDFELDQGIAIAKRGLAVDPKASFLWDTLAELHHKRGQKAEAVSAIKEAIKLDPGDKYYKEQLDKFSR